MKRKVSNKKTRLFKEKKGRKELKSHLSQTLPVSGIFARILVMTRTQKTPIKMLSADRVDPSLELAERIMPLLQRGGALDHLVCEDDGPPSQSIEVLALLAKRFIETQNLDMDLKKPAKASAMVLPEDAVGSQVLPPGASPSPPALP